MEKKINLKTNINFFLEKKIIETQTLGYSLNLFIPTFLLIISSFFQDYVLTAELGILISINIVFTQIFSANLRSLMIYKNNTKSLFSYIYFRLVISLTLILLNLIILKFLNYSNFLLLFQVSIMILLQWQIELILTSYEIKKQNYKFRNYILISVLFIFLILLDFIFIKKLVYTIIIYNLILGYFFISAFLIEKKKIASIKNIFFSSLNSSAFFSSLSISLVNLIWRFFIIFFCGKVLAGIYFASFAIGSLPGTLFNNSFGPTVINKNIRIKKKIKMILFIYILVLILLSFFSYSYREFIFKENIVTQIFATLLSLLGSIFMIRGLFERQYLIQKTKYHLNVFKYDIFYAFIILTIIPILYFLGGQKLIILSFFISSVASYILYSFLKNKLIFRKK